MIKCIAESFIPIWLCSSSQKGTFSSSWRNKAALVLPPLFPVHRMRLASEYIMEHKRNLQRDNELIATSVCLLYNNLTTTTAWQPRHN